MLGYLKIGAIAVVIIGLLWSVKTVTDWRRAAGEKEAAVAAKEQLQAEFHSYQANVAKDKAQDEQRRERLAVTLANVSTELADLKSKKPKVVYRESQPVDGVCRVYRIGPEYFELRNKAADIANHAVQLTGGGDAALRTDVQAASGSGQP